MNVSDLAGSVSVSQATMSGILERLEDQALISRARGQEDRRSTFIAMTEKGKEFLNNAPPILHDRFRHELSKLSSWEQTAILSSLQRIAEMMGAEELPAAPIITAGPECLVDPNEVPSVDG
jgi:DNA-binding MarR family transcriptional regulator